MKIKKLIIFLLCSFILFLFITLLYDKKNNLNDISKINKYEIYDSNNNLIYESRNKHFIRLNEISPLLIKSVIELEDKSYYKHNGFNLKRILYSSIYNLFNSNKIGASTITQQYIKLLYLNNNKTYKRKLKELYYSIRLENLYNKDEILEGYFNTIYFSNGITGIYDATKFYFNKEPLDLSINEIALILALIKSPNKYNPINNYNLSMERKNEILYILYKKNLITNYDYNLNKKQNIIINKSKINNYNNSVLFYKDLVFKEYESLNIKKTFNEVTKIYTYYNNDINKEIDNYITENNINCDIGLIALGNNGNIISLIGGKNYNISSYNVITMGNRDIGSTIKPIICYKALDLGLNENLKFKSEKTTFNINNQTYEIKNYNDKYENIFIDMRHALAVSDNIYACKLYLKIGQERFQRFLKKLNINSSLNLSTALGSVSMTPLNLINIYDTFKNNGISYNTSTIKNIYKNNKIVYKNNIESTKVLKEEHCKTINSLLESTFDNNIGINMNNTCRSITKYIDYKLSAKTGLTDYDSYIVGYNDKFCLLCWSGYNDNTLLTNNKDKFQSKILFYKGFNSLQKKKDI